MVESKLKMSWTFLNETKPKARKEYFCILCDCKIEVGETHIARRGVGDDGPLTARMHLACELETKNWDQGDWEVNDPGEFAHHMNQKKVQSV